MSYANGSEEQYGGSYFGSSAGGAGGGGKFEVGTFDGNRGVDEAALDDGRPKILLMGLRRSGKSSIQKVVFHKMSPNETLFLESTNKIVKEPVANSSFVQFSIWDFPGQIDFLDEEYDMESIFGGTGAMIFIIDAQDDYVEAASKLVATVIKIQSINPSIHCEVFIHKVDSLSDETKMEVQRDIHSRSLDEIMAEHGSPIPLSFYLTSIYDRSIFEAFSKVVQKLIKQLPTLENLMNMFIQHSNAEKAFLFDVVSKIYIATDSSPVDMQSYELCCDMIDLVIDVSCIYGLTDETDGSSFDAKSASVVKLNNSTVMYLKEVDKVLALVAIIREENFNRPAIIDYNFKQFRIAVNKVFAIREHYRQLALMDKKMEAANINGDKV